MAAPRVGDVRNPSGRTAATILALQRGVGNAAVATWVSSVSAGRAALGAAKAVAPAHMLQRQVVKVGPEGAPPGHFWKSTIDGATFPSEDLAKEHEAKLHATREGSDTAYTPSGNGGEGRGEVKGKEIDQGKEGEKGNQAPLPRSPASSSKARNARFLMAMGENLKMLMATVEFGAATELYNSDYWERDDEEEDALVLKSGKSPAEAITQLHTYEASGEQGRRVKLDCVEIIEVARWLAELDVVGREAFDAKYGARPFRLDAPGSTGVEEEFLANRCDGRSDGIYMAGTAPATGWFEVKSKMGQGRKIKLDVVLERLDIGSRVMWRNFDPDIEADDDFKNENTVKLGPDLYAAHPFGIGSVTELALKIGEGGYDAMRRLLDAIKEDVANWDAAKEQGGERQGEKEEENESDEGEGAGEVDDEGERRAGYARYVKLYDGVHSLLDYVNRFVRIVEVESLKSPV